MSSDREDLLHGFAEVLDWIDEWREHQGEPETYDQAGHLVVAMRELLLSAGFLDVARHRVYAEARDCDEDALPQPSDIRGGKNLLRAQRRFILDNMTDILAPAPLAILVSDNEERLAGRQPLIGGKGNVRPKFLLKQVQRRSIRTAHYRACRDGTNWHTEHARIAPMLSEGGRHEWNRLVLEPEREMVRSAGLKRGLQLPLSEPERAMEDDALRHSVEQQAIVLALLLAGGKIE